MAPTLVFSHLVVISFVKPDSPCLGSASRGISSMPIEISWKRLRVEQLL
ncbi:hypothetical protein SynMVIR181_02592 [Synechococcus sp. MVIR-18-1]|nr:hypothetical protein SynMVIR181_02592 [Synechococcus sp. MVIR-18-1]